MWTTIFRSDRLAALAAVLLATPAWAGEADVVDAEVARLVDGTYRFTVTIAHADEGWDHYADAFEVTAPNGTVLGVRELLHPHVDEQPFTRSLNGVDIPENIATVRIRAHDSVHLYGGAEIDLTLPGR